MSSIALARAVVSSGRRGAVDPMGDKAWRGRRWRARSAASRSPRPQGRRGRTPRADWAQRRRRRGPSCAGRPALAPFRRTRPCRGCRGRRPTAQEHRVLAPHPRGEAVESGQKRQQRAAGGRTLHRDEATSGNDALRLAVSGRRTALVAVWHRHAVRHDRDLRRMEALTQVDCHEVSTHPSDRACGRAGPQQRCPQDGGRVKTSFSSAKVSLWDMTTTGVQDTARGTSARLDSTARGATVPRADDVVREGESWIATSRECVRSWGG